MINMRQQQSFLKKWCKKLIFELFLLCGQAITEIISDIFFKQARTNFSEQLINQKKVHEWLLAFDESFRNINEMYKYYQWMKNLKMKNIYSKDRQTQQNSPKERPLFTGQYYNYSSSRYPASSQINDFSYGKIIPSKNTDRKIRDNQKGDSDDDSSQAQSFRSLQVTLNGICNKVRSQIKQNSENGAKIIQNLEQYEKRRKIKEDNLKQFAKSKKVIDTASVRNTCPDLIQKFEIPKFTTKKETDSWKLPRSGQKITKKASYTIEQLGSQYDQRKLKYSFQCPKTPTSYVQRSPHSPGCSILSDRAQKKQNLFKSEQNKNIFLQKLKKINNENPQSPHTCNESFTLNKQHSQQFLQKCNKQMVISEFSTIQNSTSSQQPSIIVRKKFCQTIYKKPLAKSKFSQQSFKIIKTLGKGKFGDVFLSVHRDSGLIVALKKIQKMKVKKFNMVRQVRDEIHIHSNLNHPNIVKLYGVFQEQESVYLVMQCVIGGTLFDYLNEKQKLSMNQTIKFMAGVIDGIHYMHDKSIAHRDIKPQNILIADSGVAKICDLGWSAVMTTSRKTYCGTFDYVAPQILERKDYGLAVDIWCLGILVYELLFGKMPYEGDKRTIICKKITNAQLDFPSDFPSQAKDFILWLVRKNPDQRPKCKQLLSHPFFKLQK